MYREEKKCKNPECKETIQFFDNPKKLFCSTRCKARFHYLDDCEENHEIILFEKALKKNYCLLINFLEKGVFEIDADVAKSIGFNREVFMKIERIDIGETLFVLNRIKDIHFKYNSIKNTIVIYKVAMEDSLL